MNEQIQHAWKWTMAEEKSTMKIFRKQNRLMWHNSKFPFNTLCTLHSLYKEKLEQKYETLITKNILKYS